MCTPRKPSPLRCWGSPGDPNFGIFFKQLFLQNPQSTHGLVVVSRFGPVAHCFLICQGRSTRFLSMFGLFLLDVATLDASSTFCRRSSPPMFVVAGRPRFGNISERRTFDISRRCRLREWFHSSRVSFLRLVRCIICPLVQGRKRWPEAVSAVQEVPAQLQS